MEYEIVQVDFVYSRRVVAARPTRSFSNRPERSALPNRVVRTHFLKSS